LISYAILLQDMQIWV